MPSLYKTNADAVQLYSYSTANKRYASYALLVLDEWLFDRPNDQFRGFLFELMERRYDTCSTVFCTQYQQKDWHERLGGGPHADAIMDRIVHNTIWVGTGADITSTGAHPQYERCPPAIITGANTYKYSICYRRYDE